VRDEHTPKVLDSRVLKRIFGLERDELREDLRKLHNEELNELFSTNIFRVIKSRRMRWARHVARMRETKGVYRVLVGNPEGKIPLLRPRSRWNGNIEIDLQEVECGGMDWIELTQNRDTWQGLVNEVMNLLQFP